MQNHGKKLGGVTGKGFMPGGITPNPGGRPRGLASLVRDMTKDGLELVAFMRGVERGNKFRVSAMKMDGTVVDVFRRPTIREREEAAGWLADRGWGKAVEQVEVTQPRPFVVQHRMFAPGVDPLAPGPEVAVARPALPPGPA